VIETRDLVCSGLASSSDEAFFCPVETLWGYGSLTDCRKHGSAHNFLLQGFGKVTCRKRDAQTVATTSVSSTSSRIVKRNMGLVHH
jgi:hypothetical protein